MRNIYIVKNLTSAWAVSSPSIDRKNGLYLINGDSYHLLKIDGSRVPEGDSVFKLNSEEHKAVLSLNIFASTYNNVRDYKRKDKEFCSEIVLQFQSDSGALSKADTNTLLSLLGGVLEYLNINSPHHAYTELQSVATTTLFPQPLKDKYLLILQNYLDKFPRL